MCYRTRAFFSHGHACLYRSSQSPGLLILGTLAGVVGSLLDSFLGATLQETLYDGDKMQIVGRNVKQAKRICGHDVLSNAQVNFVSVALVTVLGVAFGPRLCAQVDAIFAQ